MVSGEHMDHMGHVPYIVEEVYKRSSDIVTVHRQLSVEVIVLDQVKWLAYVIDNLVQDGQVGVTGVLVPFHVTVVLDSDSVTVTRGRVLDHRIWLVYVIYTNVPERRNKVFNVCNSNTLGFTKHATYVPTTT